MILITQVISGVPEGKGVSSSAAIEVATMSSVAASLGTITCYSWWVSGSNIILKPKILG